MSNPKPPKHGRGELETRCASAFQALGSSLVDDKRSESWPEAGSTTVRVGHLHRYSYEQPLPFDPTYTVTV
jgi:hypothetical protein